MLDIPLFRTASDGKLGGAWDEAIVYFEISWTVYHSIFLDSISQYILGQYITVYYQQLLFEVSPVKNKAYSKT